MSLPLDIARCTNDACVLAVRCARYCDPGRPDGPQAFAEFTGGEDCPDFIQVDRIEA